MIEWRPGTGPWSISPEKKLIFFCRFVRVGSLRHMLQI